MQYGAAQDQLRFGEEFGQIGCIGALAGIAKKCNGRPDVQYHIVSNRLLVGSKHYGSPGDTQFTQRQPRSAERGCIPFILIGDKYFSLF
jgi:hypothetical protein